MVKDNSDNYSKLFYRIFFITLIVKLFLSYFFPLTGDEAYFITTGKFFDFGYYEHPPMIWWFIYLFSFFGKYKFHYFFYRLFSVFSTSLVGFLIFKLISRIDKEKGYLIASLFFLSPVHLLGFLITNDTPLFLFTFLSGIFFYTGIKTERKVHFIISGIFFGLSFLSKYFSVLYFLSIFIYIIFKREKKLWFNFLIFLISSLPFISINLYWNYTHCWINFLFNLVYRKKQDCFKIKNILFFFLSLFFLLTPYFFYTLIKSKFFIRKKFEEKEDFFYFIFIIPVIFFFLLSFLREVGLHWYISFIPFIFILLKEEKKEKILKALKIAFQFEIIILTPIISLLFFPVSIFKNHKNYPEIIMFLNPYPLCEYLKNFENEYIFASIGYTESAIMSYYCKNDFIVFGDLSHSGREYDINFDFKEIDGRDILIFSPRDIDLEKYAEFFKEIKKEVIKIEGASFYLLFCKKFNYQNYRDKILRKIYEKFYKIPEFLPARGNFFKEKYGF